MATCASLAVGKPVPLLRDVVGSEAFRGGFKALRAAFPAAGSVQSADAVRAALSCGCELAAGGVRMIRRCFLDARRGTSRRPPWDCSRRC